MKKIILSLVILSLFTFSCERDDGITYTTPDYISGKWVFDKVGTINPQPVYSVIYQDYQNDANCIKDNFLLNADGTFSINDYTPSGSTCVNNARTGSYTLVNKDVTLSYTVNNLVVLKTYTITALTYTELTIASDENGVTTFYKLIRE